MAFGLSMPVSATDELKDCAVEENAAIEYEKIMD
jgi:hypothetical protein